jgi:hypothetical protein
MYAASANRASTNSNALPIENVFSAYTYTGNASSRSIVNGINLAGKGGLVWTKRRDAAYGHLLQDTVNGSGKYFYVIDTTAINTYSGYVQSFDSNGYSIASGDNVNNANTFAYVSWSFAQAPKFFQVAQATVAGGVTATIDLSSLGTVGMVAVKRTDSTGDWYVFHRSCTSGKLVYLNKTDAEATLGHITLSGTTLSLVGGTIANGSYIIYAWAHDTGTNGLIQCGSVADDGAGNATITLGWEPQYVLFKNRNNASTWSIMDTSRSFTVSSVQRLFAENSGAEDSASTAFTLNATGFKMVGGYTSTTLIYMAIRRGPMHQPTLGTQVYNAIATTGTGTSNRVITGVGFPPDLTISIYRDLAGGTKTFNTRLIGPAFMLDSTAATAETSRPYGVSAFGMDGFTQGNSDAVGYDYSTGGPHTFVFWNFRRYPGVFDEVCYTGTGSATTFAHNLGVAPEFIIVKSRSNAYDWITSDPSSGGWIDRLLLDDSGATYTGGGSGIFNSTAPTSTVFSVGNSGSLNGNGATFVAYLFATLAGISKVGSYTGDGSTNPGKTINCGFSTGARFVMIKRTDSTGDWFTWDSTRGIVAGNDPHLSLNTTATEVTTDDSIDPDNSGFIVNQLSATNINVTSATYIFLAFS